MLWVGYGLRKSMSSARTFSPFAAISRSACVEHYPVKTLIEKFDSLKPGDHDFDATFKVMTELVKHHVEEEESQLFPELRETGVDLVALGEKLSARKNELMKKLEAARSKLVGDRSLSFNRAA